MCVVFMAEWKASANQLAISAVSSYREQIYILANCQDGKQEHLGTVVPICSGNTAVNKQTNKPLTPPLFLMSFKGGWTTQTAALSLSFSLWEPILLMQSERERERLMREFKGGRGQERDVEEREQLVLRADTGHVGKGSAAAYGAVKRPFSLSLFISLPGLSSPCRYGDRDLLPSYGQPAGLRLFWDQHQVFAEILGQQWVQTQHTHAMFCIHVRCSCICVLTLL